MCDVAGCRDGGNGTDIRHGAGRDEHGGSTEAVPDQQGRGAVPQYCHGSPGFVINLAGFTGPELDAVLLGAGQAAWSAGPLNERSNLCHGTGGNGYAFLKLFGRTGDLGFAVYLWDCIRGEAASPTLDVF